MADPASFGVESQQDLGDCQGDQFAVAQFGSTAPARARWHHMVVEEDVQCSQEGV